MTYRVAAFLWWLVAVVTLLWGRGVVEALRTRGLLGPSSVLGLLLFGVGLALFVRRLRLGRRAAAGVLAGVAVLLVWAALLERPEERSHVVQYGVLGALLWAGMGRLWVAAAIACAAGLVDEALQGLLPDRVYDVTDMALNVGAGLAGVGVGELGRRLESRGGTMARRGVPVVVSAPSGAGKTTMCHELIRRLPGVEFSVSHTTRAPRGKEKHGVDYYFVDDAAFAKLVKDEAMLEWADVHGKRYGTSRAEADKRIDAGIDVLFDIDVQGGRQIKERLSGAVLVFVLPPDAATLEKRLRERKSDSEEQIQRRLETAREEIRAAQGLYPYWIVNDDLDTAVRQLEAILLSERVRRTDVAALAKSFIGERR